MKLLLDTHVILGWLADEPLRKETLDAIGHPRSIVYASAASAWEIGIKMGLGKLRPPADIETQLQAERFTRLPVTLTHGFHVGKQPLLHTDPFDRLLVAQAQLEGLTIVTRDPRIAAYDVETLVA